MKTVTIRYTGKRTSSKGYRVQGYTTHSVAAGNNDFHRQRIVDERVWRYMQEKYPLEFIEVPHRYPAEMTVNEDIRLVPGLTDKHRDQLVELGFQTTGEVIAASKERNFYRRFRKAIDILLARAGLEVEGTAFSTGTAEEPAAEEESFPTKAEPETVAEPVAEEPTDDVVDESAN